MHSLFKNVTGFHVKRQTIICAVVLHPENRRKAVSAKPGDLD